MDVELDWDSVHVLYSGNAYWHSSVETPTFVQESWVLRIDTNGCLVPGCNLVTGITGQYVDLSAALSLLPNPGNDRTEVNISLPPHHKLSRQLQLTIVSIDGKRIEEHRLPSALDQKFLLDVSLLPTGVYYVHLSDGATWLAGQKFIVK